MPSTPYATLLAAVNGGAPTAGGLTVAVGDVIQLSAESTVGWTQQRYEIYSGAALFPLTVPAGWSTDGTTGAFFYSTTPTPPPFMVPAGWGKLLLSLRANDGADDSALYDGAGTALLVISPTGLVDICWGETTQYSTAEKWMAAWRADLRVISASVAAGVTLAGDLLGVGSTTAVPRTSGINSTTVGPGGALSAGQVLRATGVSAAAWGAVDLTDSDAVTGALPAANQAAQTMGGDVTGTTAVAVVAKVNGTSIPAGPLTTGTVLRATGAAASAWGALDLANASAVTGALPTANQTSQTMAGDVTGTTAAGTVARVNGATVPAAGSLTTGNAAYVSGASALTYSALNLAGGSGWVTGVLPTGNQAAQAMAGDVTGTTAASTVAKVNGATYPAAGALTTGTVPRVTGAAAVAYGALDLANVAAVTGLLPSGNVDATSTPTAGRVSKWGASTEMGLLFFSASGLSIGQAPSFGGGVGVVGLVHRTTAPTTAPTGGVVLSSNVGAVEVWTPKKLLVTLSPETNSAATDDRVGMPIRRNVHTSDATVTQIATYLLPAACSAVFDVIIQGQVTGSDARAVYTFTVSTGRAAGVAAVDGVLIVTTVVDNITIVGAPTVTTDGVNTIRFNVTPRAGTEIDWAIRADVAFFSP